MSKPGKPAVLAEIIKRREGIARLLKKFPHPHDLAAALLTETERRKKAETALLRQREALERIAEGNLGDKAWQANYERVREVARAALSDTAEGE